MKVFVTESEIQRSAELLALAQEMEQVAGWAKYDLELIARATIKGSQKSVSRGKPIYTDYRDLKAAECAVAELARATAIEFCKKAAAIYRKHMPIPAVVNEEAGHG